MNGSVALFLACAALAQFLAPRRWLAMPMLLTFAWLPREQALEVGDVKLTAFRLVVALALVRILVRRERLPGGVGLMDKVWMFWSLLMITTWLAHSSNDLAFRLGLVWDYFGSYLVLRCAIASCDDIERVFATFCMALVPVAVLMVIERQSGQNPFAAIGGLATQWREGNFRAAGPFAHPILAGSVGATCLIMGCALWRWRRLLGTSAIGAGLAIVYASASSGPILMSVIGIVALLAWRWRRHLTGIRWLLLFTVLALQVAMHDPVYYLMAKVDLVGGSTGWYRARLIQSALEHLDEWWLAGTDYTRHWMPSGIPASAQHTDITNHYLMMGVMGGLPLLLTFTFALLLVLRRVDRVLVMDDVPERDRFVAWSVGAVLLAHGINFLTAYLFDQSIVSFMICFACAAALGKLQFEASPVSSKGQPISAGAAK